MTAPIYIGQRVAGSAGPPPDFLLDLVVTSTPGTDGSEPVAAFGAVDPAEHWSVERLIVSCESMFETTARVYDDLALATAAATQFDPAAAAAALLDYTLSGNEDVAEYDHGQVIQPGRTLCVVWFGGYDSVGTARVIGRRVRSGGVL
jgi:hypothetical protein